MDEMTDKSKPKYSDLFMVFVLTLLAIFTLVAIFNVVTDEPEETPQIEFKVVCDQKDSQGREVCRLIQI